MHLDAVRLRSAASWLLQPGVQYQPLQWLTHVLRLPDAKTPKNLILEHLMQDSHGAALASGLSAVAWDRVVRKGADKDADASSPFRDLHGTDLGLAAYLRERGVQARCPALRCSWGLGGWISGVCVGAQVMLVNLFN